MRSLEKQCIEQAEMIGLRHYISLLINYVDGSKYNLYVMKYMVGLIPLSLPLASLLLYGLSFSHTHTQHLLFVPHCGIFCIYRCPPGCTIAWVIKIKSVEINIQHSRKPCRQLHWKALPETI